MEEIVSASAIQAEILDEARKKAERSLAEAEEESARATAETEAKAASVVQEIMSTSAAGSRRFRLETMARLPLERTRMRTVFVALRLREALAAYLALLGEAEVCALIEPMLARGAPYLAGKAVLLSRKGLSREAALGAATRLLSTAASVDFAEDEALQARGLVAAARDGSVTLRATMDLVEERLLDERRRELAEALCPEALAGEEGE